MRVEKLCQGGFTLLELLIAIVVFALMMVPAYGWMSNLLNQVDYSDQQAGRLGDLQMAYQVLQRDLEQLADRGIRNEFGDPVVALVGGSGFTGVEFTRAGYPNPAGYRRSELQRVAYIPDDDRLLRHTWRVLDRAQDSLPAEQVLVEDMENFNMRFLDPSGSWQERWPPLQETPGDSAGFPRAVEVQLELKDLGELNWLFLLPQNFVVTDTGIDTASGNADGTDGDTGEDDGSGDEGQDGDEDH